MLKPIISQFKPAQRGVVLLEALVAILIFSIGILGIVGMQANMLRNTSDSKYRADASDVAQQRIGQIWADPVNALAGTFAGSYVLPASTLPNGSITTQQVGAKFTVKVEWTAPGGDKHNYTTVANIAGN